MAEQFVHSLCGVLPGQPDDTQAAAISHLRMWLAIPEVSRQVSGARRGVFSKA
jgi:hypothetical protein